VPVLSVLCIRSETSLAILATTCDGVAATASASKPVFKSVSPSGSVGTRVGRVLRLRAQRMSWQAFAQYCDRVAICPSTYSRCIPCYSP
jgi:hypothetical protein